MNVRSLEPSLCVSSEAAWLWEVELDIADGGMTQAGRDEDDSGLPRSRCLPRLRKTADSGYRRWLRDQKALVRRSQNVQSLLGRDAFLSGR